MAQFLKRRADISDSSQKDNNTQSTVAEIISAVEKGGDNAVRKLLEKFDRWSPMFFRLSGGEIESYLNSISEETHRDIEFAQNQIRRFAERQLESFVDIEVETLPGVRL